MKLLFITDPIYIGGATRSLSQLVTILHNDYNVDITLVTSSRVELNNKMEKLGIKTVTDGHRMAMFGIPPETDFIHWAYHKTKRFLQYLTFPLDDRHALKVLESKLDLSSFDLIHTNSARSDIGCLISEKYHIPHIMHLREFGTLDFDCHFYRRNYYQFINKGTTQFVSVSDAVGKYWISQGIDKEKWQTIYNGVDDENIEPILSETSYYSLDLHIVMTGTLMEAKGQYQLIEALAYIPKEIRTHLFVDFYGWTTDQYLSKLKELAKKANIDENHIRFCGLVPSVSKVLKNYQIATTCSKSEGFGLVTAENMIAGLGVIASNTGANPELIHDNETGLLYHWGDPKDLAKKITLLYTNRELLKKLGKNARLYAISHFTKEINAKNIYQLYQSVLTRNPKS